MYVCPCRARKYDQNGPYIHTYIHGPMPFQKGSIFPCMFTFAHAGRGTVAAALKTSLMCIHTYIHPDIQTFISSIRLNAEFNLISS